MPQTRTNRNARPSADVARDVKKAKYTASSATFKRLRSICLALPGATETLTWGHPLFRVADKIFVGYGDDGGGEVMSVKVGKGRQAELIRDARFAIAPYVGRFGWVQFKLSGKVNWDEVTGLVLESYRLIAPKPLLKRMDGDCGIAVKVTRSQPAKRRSAKSRRKRG